MLDFTNDLDEPVCCIIIIAVAEVRAKDSLQGGKQQESDCREGVEPSNTQPVRS